MRTKDDVNKVLNEFGGLYTFEDLMQHILDGRMQSFANGDTWVVTQLNIFPQRKVLEVVLVMGNLEDLEVLEAQIIGFAKSVGASLLSATGRLGWGRKTLKNWRKVSENYVREI